MSGDTEPRKGTAPGRKTPGSSVSFPTVFKAIELTLGPRLKGGRIGESVKEKLRSYINSYHTAKNEIGITGEDGHRVGETRAALKEIQVRSKQLGYKLANLDAVTRRMLGRELEEQDVNTCGSSVYSLYFASSAALRNLPEAEDAQSRAILRIQLFLAKLKEVYEELVDREIPALRDSAEDVEIYDPEIGKFRDASTGRILEVSSDGSKAVAGYGFQGFVRSIMRFVDPAVREAVLSEMIRRQFEK